MNDGSCVYNGLIIVVIMMTIAHDDYRSPEVLRHRGNVLLDRFAAGVRPDELLAGRRHPTLVVLRALFNLHRAVPIEWHHIARKAEYSAWKYNEALSDHVRPQQHRARGSRHG